MRQYKTMLCLVNTIFIPVRLVKSSPANVVECFYPGLGEKKRGILCCWLFTLSNETEKWNEFSKSNKQTNDKTKSIPSLFQGAKFVYSFWKNCYSLAPSFDTFRFFSSLALIKRDHFLNWICSPNRSTRSAFCEASWSYSLKKRINIRRKYNQK